MCKKFADNLWNEAYRLHGTLNMVELCRLMIFAMFIKYIDLEKEGGAELPSYDNRLSVGYVALTYGEMISREQLADYIHDAETDMMLNDRIISAEFKSLLDKSDDSQVQKIFRSIYQTDFKDKGQLYDTASLLLEKLSFQHGNLKSGTSSNLSLCRLEGRLLECREGMTVYDGFCGYGFSANEAADGRGIVYIQDTNRSAAAIAAVMALLKGNRIGASKCGDSLTSLILSEAKYDRVVCEPPFVSKYDEEYRSSINKDNFLFQDISDDASIALQHALARLKDGGRACVLVPMGILVNKKSSEIRKKLIESYIDSVIELPAEAIPNAESAAALLVLEKDTDRKNIFLINAKEFFHKGEKNQLVISDENINRLVEAYKRRETAEGVSIDLVKTKIEESRSNLGASKYVVSDPQKAITIGDTSAYLDEYRQLAGQLAEIDSMLSGIRGRFVTNAG